MENVFVKLDIILMMINVNRVREILIFSFLSSMASLALIHATFIIEGRMLTVVKG